MSCQTIEELLALYLDDALTPTERQRVEQHLADCSDCRDTLAELRQMQLDLRALPLPPLPANFRDDLLQRVAKQPRKQPVWRFLAPRLGSLAASLLVVLLVSNLYLFPHYWPQQSPADDATQPRVMFAPPVSAGAGDTQFEATAKQENDSTDGYRSALMAAPTEQPNFWLWSSLGAIGLFGAGSGFFVWRYRRN